MRSIEKNVRKESVKGGVRAALGFILSASRVLGAHPFGAAFAASLLGFLIASMTEFTLQTPKELQFFMLFLGAVEATKRLAPERVRKKDAVPPEPAPETANAAE